MKKLKLVRVCEQKTAPSLMRCPVVILTLDNGEVIKRGCGRSGMVKYDACLRCLYCGNYLYQKVPSLDSLWFHFRWAREFWRIHNTRGRDFVNGIPVTGKAETLPASCLPDLAESRPPWWFSCYLKSSEQEFRDCMFNVKTG